MGNVFAVGAYPFVQFQPSETSGVQHTDQEFTDSNDNSYLFRMYNAEYDPSGPHWKTLPGGGSDAYATVQNPDGSIHYYTNPSGMTTWTAWVGSDNNTVYNAVDFGTPPLSAGGSALNNTAALTTMLAAMGLAPGLPGGMAWIPQYEFLVSASTSGITIPSGCIVQGLGTGGQSGTKAFHFSIADPTLTGPNIFLNCSGAHTSGGTYLNNLAFHWVTPEFAKDTCLFLDYWNSTARDCTFTDCPTAVNMQGLGSLLDHCTISYRQNINNPSAVTAILLGAINAQISGPSEFNGNIGGGGSPVGTDTCISIGGGTPSSNECTISRVHIVGWSYGIDYSDINMTGVGSGTQDNVIRDCVMECNVTCVNLTPISGKQIFNQKFVDNTITKGQDSPNGGPIVFIDSNEGVETNIGPIDLVNNTIYSNVTGGDGQGGMGGHSGEAQDNQYGVQIGTCAAVSIIGGQISQMGGNNGTTGSANICISGDPAYVLIDSVNLSAVYAGANHGTATGSTGSAASYYGLFIPGGPDRVIVNNCDLTGVTVPVGVSPTSTLTYLSVTNCPGYNDQNTPINTITNITTGVAYKAAAQSANGGTSYWGPSFVMFTANSSGGTFQYNGGAAQTLLPSQVVCLTLASPYDTIQFNTHAPAAFAWIGK